MTKKIKILIADDDLNTLDKLQSNLEQDYQIETISDYPGILDKMKSMDPDLLIFDVEIANYNGLEILSKIREELPDIFIIILTASQDIDLAVKAMKLGAHEYLTKPVNIELVKTLINKALSVYQLQNEVGILKDKIRRKEVFSHIIGESSSLRSVFDESEKVMDKDVNVLILGESGTGKELLARAVHNGSKRNKGPFVVVNCAAITTELADSLLFGHKKGSFTGAINDNTGYFEQANGGTIFLDEIGDMNIDVQAKVLRVIEDKKVRKVGDNKEVEVNFRIISATNRNFKEIIASNEFRSDLYYRLEEYPLQLPPLRDRQGDIDLLANHFLREFCIFYEVDYMSFSDTALMDLHEYNWPGNIRELKNIIQRAAVQAASDEIGSISIMKDRDEIDKNTDDEEAITTAQNISYTGSMETLEEMEQKAIEKAFHLSEGNPEKACLMLGISRATLYRKLKKYHIKA